VTETSVSHIESSRVVSLFAGLGGMDIGVEGDFNFLGINYPAHQTRVVQAVEFDQRIADIYKANFEAPCLVDDIRSVASSDIAEHDILLGGFPCQSFSIVAQNPPRLGFKDERGQLFFEMSRILRDRQPQVFVAENVKGILSANKRQAFPLIVEEFRQAGYNVDWKLLNASDYGIPQKRERVFIVGFRSKAVAARFSFPGPVTPLRDVPLSSVLMPQGEIPENAYFSERALRGLEKTRLRDEMTKGRVQAPGEPSNTVGAHLAKVSLNSTDPVVRTGGRLRMFTPREVARIQSFPETFQLSGTRTLDYKALGNAVPPVLMWHVTAAVMAALGSPTLSKANEATLRDPDAERLPVGVS